MRSAVVICLALVYVQDARESKNQTVITVEVAFLDYQVSFYHITIAIDDLMMMINQADSNSLMAGKVNVRTHSTNK